MHDHDHDSEAYQEGRAEPRTDRVQILLQCLNVMM